MRTAIVLLVLVSALAAAPHPATALCDYFNFTLDSGQVVPTAQGVTGSGWSELHLCEDDSLRGYVDYNLIEPPTAAHIHGPAELTENGPQLAALPLHGKGHISVRIGNMLQYRDWFILNRCYIDLHTADHPDGAIRGVIHAEIAVHPIDWSNLRILFK